MYVRPHLNTGIASSHLKRFGWERVGKKQGFLSLGPIFLNIIWKG